MTETRMRCTGATCKAIITWSTLTGDASGKPHPFDEVTCRVCRGKGYYDVLQGGLFTDEAPTPGKAACGRCKGKGTVLRSHFESCPDAPAFRKKEKR